MVYYPFGPLCPCHRILITANASAIDFFFEPTIVIQSRQFPSKNSMKRYIKPPNSGSISVYLTHRPFASTGPSTSNSPIDKYQFPAHNNPTSYEILNLPLNPLPEDIKKRYLELTKLYHPDTRTAQEVPENVANARFHAVTAAYHSLQQARGPLNRSHDSLPDSEADEIKKRLAKWGTTGSRLSPLERARRERALNAEKNAGKWWKTDMTLYYILGGAAIAIAVMQFQGRSTTQRERVKRYLEMRHKPTEPTSPPKQP